MDEMTNALAADLAAHAREVDARLGPLPAQTEPAFWRR
jgi:hypothetical protein